MNPPALDLQDIHKSFRRWEHNSLKQWALAGLRRNPERLHVLRGINLQVQQGEFVALIGRNGSGKSTLFRVLGGIWPADSGQLQVRGRVAPLIELLAGFHPDLTGMENLILNAVILGLSVEEAQRRAPDIVAYAGMGDFMGTPARFYSNGMLSRLGFAITVMVDADILLIDEVLAVGDEAFQRQCLATLRQRHQRGVTIVFVTHDLLAAEREATRAVWLADGRVALDGTPADVVAKYREACIEPIHGT